jgi:hypothetical protein
LIFDLFSEESEDSIGAIGIRMNANEKSTKEQITIYKTCTSNKRVTLKLRIFECFVLK